jgi:DedD protein
MEENHIEEHQTKKENVDTLDDLIIKSNRSSGLKKLLLAAAILLLVLILIILITKSLVQSDQKPQSSVILPPEPATVQQSQKKEPLFEQVPIEEEKSGNKKIDQVIEKLKSEPQTSAPVETTQQPAPTKPQAASAPVKPAEEPKAAAPVQKKSVATPQPTVKKERARQGSGYFIQVGAFFRYPPDKKFLNAIEKEGLHYVIVEGVKSGKKYKKVLVGPYSTKSAAKKDLALVKKRINQNAYITYKK